MHAAWTLQDVPDAHAALMQLLPPLLDLEAYVVAEEDRTCLPDSWQQCMCDVEKLDTQAKHTWEVLLAYDKEQEEAQKVGV